MIGEINKLITYLKSKNPIFGDFVYYFEPGRTGEYTGIDDRLPRQMYLRFQEDGDQIEFDNESQMPGMELATFRLFLVIASGQGFDLNSAISLITGHLKAYGGITIEGIGIDTESIYKDETREDGESELKTDYLNIIRVRFKMVKFVSIDENCFEGICENC